MHKPETDTSPSSHKGWPRSDNQCMSQTETRVHSDWAVSPTVLEFLNYDGVFSCSEARNCRSFQRSLAAERIGEELEDWRRTVDEYNKVVCDLTHVMYPCTI